MAARVVFVIFCCCSALFKFELLLLGAAAQQPEEPKSGRVNVILLGATGNLAQKYLWQAYFDISLLRGPYSLKFWGAAREDSSSGVSSLRKVMDAGITCNMRLHFMDAKNCGDAVEKFKNSVEYVRLSTSEDFQSLAATLAKDSSSEVGRLFYLSVPPFAYSDLASKINQLARPASSAWLRVAIEKPFGSDLASAETMATELAASLKEDELYRVDHYLGKRGVQQISEFFDVNERIHSLLDNEHVRRVDITMKETEDCKGRSKFYDHYGVVRDVLQNHLTEIFALVAMDRHPGAHSSRLLHAKAELLHQTALSLDHVLLGQYSTYAEEVKAESGHEDSDTSTFAAAVLHVRNHRWRGVPFVLSSGKKLDERVAFVRLLFKPSVALSERACPRCVPELIFHIQGGGSPRAMVVVSRMLSHPVVPTMWEMSENATHYILYPAPSTFVDAPYTSLTKKAISGEQDAFVGREGLLASWRLWDPLLRDGVAESIHQKKYRSAVEVKFELNEIGHLVFMGGEQRSQHSDL